MTPEERATAITRHWKAIELSATTLSGDPASKVVGGHHVAIVTQAITDAIREAVLAERDCYAAELTRLAERTAADLAHAMAKAAEERRAACAALVKIQAPE